MWSIEILDEVLSSDWVSRLTIDELLSIFWFPSAVRGSVLDIERATRDLEARLQRPGTSRELARELNIDVRGSFARIGRSKNDPLDALRNVSDSDGDAVSLHDTLPASHGPEAQASVDEGEMRSRIAGAIAALSAREKDVVTLCHSLHLTLREVGHVYGFAEQPIDIVYARGVLRLRSMLPEVVRVAEGPKRGSASRGLWAFRQSRGTDGFWHVLVGEPPYHLTLCGQRYSLPVTHSHEVWQWTDRSPLCPTCKHDGDWGRPYGQPFEGRSASSS